MTTDRHVEAVRRVLSAHPEVSEPSKLAVEVVGALAAAPDPGSAGSIPTFHGSTKVCDLCGWGIFAHECPTALEALAAAPVDRDGLAEALEAEWYNGNLDEKVYRRLVRAAGVKVYPSALPAPEPKDRRLCRRRSGEPQAEECGLPYGHEPPHHPRAMVAEPEDGDCGITGCVREPGHSGDHFDTEGPVDLGALADYHDAREDPR